MKDKNESNYEAETQTTILQKKAGIYDAVRRERLENPDCPQHTEEEIEVMCLDEGV
jgi:hypothetical protein